MSKVLMIQGTMSNAGKSLLVAGLCRIFAQDGYRVAPFKSQNMALNSYITKDGKEMGRAQVMQAQAAYEEPSVWMNPILLKPTNDVGSQVIVNGVAQGNMAARDYFKYKTSLIPRIMEAYGKLEEDHDIIVIEGAGSPAEINLKENDIVNMGMARMVDAPVLLCGDIDPGGVFAQLYGTVALLEDEEQDRIKGLIINKFRGDVSLLMPGVKMLEDKIHKPVLGVVPYMQIQVDDEDSLSDHLTNGPAKAIDLAVIRLPHMSNFSDMTVFAPYEEVSVRYVTSVEQIGQPDMVILPGSKNTLEDLSWVKTSGFAHWLDDYVAHDGLLWGICGGFQILQDQISDPHGMESANQSLSGLGYLPLTTVIEEEKTTRQTKGCFHDLEDAYSCLNGMDFEGYEIHMGQTCNHDKESVRWGQHGNVAGSYVHGIFDGDGIAENLIQMLADRKGIKLAMTKGISLEDFRNSQYDILADTLRQHLDMDEIYRIMGIER